MPACVSTSRIASITIDHTGYIQSHSYYYLLFYLNSVLTVYHYISRTVELCIFAISYGQSSVHHYLSCHLSIIISVFPPNKLHLNDSVITRKVKAITVSVTHITFYIIPFAFND